MPEWLAITPDRRQEPTEPKCARIDPGPADLARQENRLRLYLLKERIEVEHSGRTRDWIDNAIKIVRTASTEHGISARPEAEDCRRRHRLQPAGVDRRKQARLQSDKRRRPNDLGRTGKARSERQFVRQLSGIGGNAIIAGDPTERPQAYIERGLTNVFTDLAIHDLLPHPCSVRHSWNSSGLYMTGARPGATRHEVPEFRLTKCGGGHHPKASPWPAPASCPSIAAVAPGRCSQRPGRALDTVDAGLADIGVPWSKRGFRPSLLAAGQRLAGSSPIFDSGDRHAAVNNCDAWRHRPRDGRGDLGGRLCANPRHARRAGRKRAVWRQCRLPQLPCRGRCRLHFR